MQHSTFDMNLLKVLNILFEERSVTRAGERLGRTQSAVSNSLRKLREILNDPLLVRGSDGLVLTPKARTLEEQVRNIIRMTDTCLADSAGFDPLSTSGRCRLGAPDRLSLPVMLPLLKTLRSLAPRLAVDLVTTDRNQALTLLDTDKLDIAIGWFDHPPTRFNASLLFQEVLVCLCRKRHPILETQGAIDLAKILSFPHLVVSSAGDRQAAFDTMLAGIGQQRDATISVSNFGLVPNLLRENDVIGVFTERIANVLARDSHLTTLPMPLEIGPLDHYLVWHNRYHADQQHQWIRDQVRQACNR